MNGGDLASHVCVQTEAGGAWGLQEGHVGAELTITYKMMPVGFSLQRYNLPSSFFFFFLHFQLMTQGNRTARSFLEYFRAQGSQL